jgi:hypothetical protein
MDSYFLNTITSLFLCFTPLVFLILKPTKKLFTIEDWFVISTKVLLVVNISAFFDFFYVMLTKTRLLDDGFLGLYGISGLNMHTLSIINFTYAIYHFNIKNYKWFLFFAFCGFMCFYGLGLLLFILAFSITLLMTLNKRYLVYVLFSPVIVIGIIVFTSVLNPKIFNYMGNNLIDSYMALETLSYDKEMEDVLEHKRVATPRKLLSFVGGYNRITSDYGILFYGTSPGTYNSRTSFLLNGEYSSSKMAKFVNNQPKFAIADIYPLWNKDINYQYNDGTRNQPFSSVLSFVMEYGILISIMAVFLLKDVYSRIRDSNKNLKLFVRFFFLFFVLNILSENYLEYPELMVLVIILLKSMEINDLKNSTTIEK